MRDPILTSEFHVTVSISRVRLAICLSIVSCLTTNVFGQDVEPETAGETTVKLFQSRLVRDVNGIPQLSSIAQCQAVQQSNLTDTNLSLFNITSRDTELHSLSNASNQVQTLADVLLESNEKKLHISGNVEISDANSVLLAHDLTIDHQTEILTASGNVSIETEQAFFSAQTLTQNQSTQQSQIDDAQFYLFANHARGGAEQINLDPSGKLSLQELSFTTCPVGEESWSLNASEMQINQAEAEGEAWDTVLRVKGVPVFYFPYVSFPIGEQRKSGLLVPKLKSNERNGTDISLPIYWNAAANFDATLTPRSIEKRGEQFGSEWRWLTQKSYSELQFEWMNKDKLVQQQIDDPLLAPSAVSSAERWSGQMNNSTRLSEFWRIEVNALRVSDSDYFRDFDSGIESTNQTRLDSQFGVSYRSDIWRMNFAARTQQSLIGDQTYRYLPSWTTAADYTAENGIRWQWESDATLFAHKDIEKLEGLRINTTPSISYPMQSSWGFLTPKASYSLSEYSQENQITGEKTKLSRDLPVFSIDSGIYLERNMTFAAEDYVHSLEPRVFYAYVPFEDQQEINNFDTTEANFDFNQLFRANRFVGNDRIGDTNQLSFALANAFSKLNTGEEVLKLTLGRTYYLDEREVQLANSSAILPRQSPWLAKLDYRMNAQLSVSSLIEWDSQTNQTNRAESSINFEPKDNHIVNLTHRYRDLAGELNEELDFSFAWSINQQWRMLGRWYNDMQRNQTIEALVGIEYESCCWAIRLVADKYLNTQLDNQGIPITIGGDQYSQGFHLQFVFKGLGSVGQSGLNQQLSSSIKGYRDPFNSARSSYN